MGITYCLDKLPHLLVVRLTSSLNGHEKVNYVLGCQAAIFSACTPARRFYTVGKKKKNSDSDARRQLYIRGQLLNP